MPDFLTSASHSPLPRVGGSATPLDASKLPESAPRVLLTDGASLPGSLWSDLIGVPYQVHARGPDAYDCWGLLLEIHRRRNIVIGDFSYSSDGFVDDGTEIRVARRWKPCPIAGGASLLFRADGGGRHAGVALDEDRFIHANDRNRSVVVSRLSRGYKSYLVGAYEPL